MTLPRGLARLWPRRLGTQMMLVMALALLMAQAVSALLLWRAEMERQHDITSHQIAFRLVASAHLPMRAEPGGPQPDHPDAGWGHGGPPPPSLLHPGALPMLGPVPENFDHGPLARPQAAFAPIPGDIEVPSAEKAIRAILAEQAVPVAAFHIYRRDPAHDPDFQRRLATRNAIYHGHPFPRPDHVLVAALQVAPNGPWLVTHVGVPPNDPRLLATLIGQTLLIYVVLVAAMALIVRRISRPLAALTGRVNRFGAQGFAARDVVGQIQPAGPQDLRLLIEAHNAMERRIIALLDEKDVMLGAIGHDLKTPLTTLRVRIESVEDADERRRMAHTIDDIARSLDDMLSLARVGRPSDPIEVTELLSLVSSVVEEFEDLGAPVEMGDSGRVALPLRPTWLRRALRNLIGNAVRYGDSARVSVTREEIPATGRGVPQRWAVIRIDDVGPGIAAGDIDRMMEPFTRGEPSRNSETGGAGLGLTLARAIAEQHGGTLVLANRGDGPSGLTATLRLPIP